MTVRVTSLMGTGAGLYYTERLSSYYVSGTEAPSRWWGLGADRLGLKGRLDPDAFLAVIAGEDPDTGKVLGRRYGEGSVRGYDATFSAPKSVSVLWAFGDETIRGQVVESHDRAVDAVLGWIQDHAHTRLRRHGHITNVDAQGLIVGVFREHTSRRLDPQLHTHAVIANRVPAPDGRWLALDARTMMVDQRTLSAVYHAGLRAELTRRLGVAWQPTENGIAEIEHIPEDLLGEFSQRTRDLKIRLDTKRQRFRETMGREPTRKEDWRLGREAALDSRPGKPDQPTMGELREDWWDRTRRLGLDPGRVMRQALGRHIRSGGLDLLAEQRMVGAALVSLAESQSSWRPAELVRELAAATPTTTTMEAQQLTHRLDALTDRAAVERCVDISRPVPIGVELRRDGRPVTEPAVNRALTTQPILSEEQQVIDWAERQARTGSPLPVPDRSLLLWNPQLSAGQAQAVRAVAGNRGLELIVGPAGTGKTTALRTAVELFERARRPIFGVAPTAAAAQVLADETGMAADTLDKLLVEHDQPDRPPLPSFDLPAGATVVLDEAGTASTPNLARLARLAEEKDWRVVMVGDPRQFNAVGRGGMYTHFTERHDPVQLDEVHRFTNEWERKASLRLRDGNPMAIGEYDRQGRIHGGTTEEMETKVIADWQKARSDGQTVILIANSNATVARLNKRVQQIRIMAGELDISSPWVKAKGGLLFVGDEVVTRRNDRRLQTSQGHSVKNRDHWTLTAIHDDGAVTVHGPTGLLQLPSEYVGEQVELGYAQTSYTSQGRTVDTALLLVDTATDSRGVYTAMTRGREANHAYVAIEENQTARDILVEAISRDWIDQPAVARRDQLDPHRTKVVERNAPGVEPEVDERMQQIQQALERGRARRQGLERSRSLGLSL